MNNPLEITETIGGRERKLCLNAYGMYKAIKDYGYGDDLARSNSDLGTKDIVRLQLEELWIAVLPYEDISLKDFLSEIGSHEMQTIHKKWLRLKQWQGETQEVADEQAEVSDEAKKKRKAKRSSKASAS